MYWTAVLSIILLSITCQGENLNAPIVHTKYGSLKGSVFADRNGNDFFAFRSIPYAKAPIGDLRFKAPQPAEKWEGVRDATNEMPLCAQYTTQFVGQEDCLHLNVYTPQVNSDTKSLLPVMVYIHGGYFLFGSGVMNDLGPQYLITKNIVVVNIHYRLSALGFASLAHKSTEISANNGLKDQVAALKWVQENIKQFGGDPNQVTVFGESAGSASVHYLLLSPLAKGLFQRAILESGAATAHWANGANNSATHLAKQLKITTENELAMITALKSVPLLELLEAQEKIFIPTQSNTIEFGTPTVEGPGEDSFLVDHPKNIVNAGNFFKVPFLIGYNNKEGIMFDQIHRAKNETFIFNPKEVVPYYLDQSKFDDIVEEIKKFYWSGSVPTDSKDLVDVLTDFYFKYNPVEDAQKHGDSVPVYLYEFSMDTELNLFKKQNPVTATYPGACHVDELFYLFKSAYTPHIKAGSIEDISISRMVTLWTNFAKYGNPTPAKDELLQNQIWSPINSKDLNYLSLSENIEAKKYDNVNHRFWKSLYKKYGTFEN